MTQPLNDLQTTINKIATRGKGILAADESNPTIGKRFEAVGIESTEETRRQYRELLITAPGFQQYIAGVILFEETLNQKTHDGIPFAEALKKQGVLPGIKVDKGLINIPGTFNPQTKLAEQLTQGLDGLEQRLAEYKDKGACFAKWRAVYAVSDSTPSDLAIRANAFVLARYAAICQEQGIVPIVEPEVLIDGDHTIDRCEAVTEPVLNAVFAALNEHKVKLEYIVLKPSMVIHGKTSSQKAGVKEVADATLRVLRRTVPAAVPTINFLSGGQTSEQATAHLNAMNQDNSLPWNLSFSYARALQDYCMKVWKGQSAQVNAAQSAFIQRAKLNCLAATGAYNNAMENETLKASA